MAAHTTRRALLGAATSLPVLAVAATTAAAPTLSSPHSYRTALDVWRRAHELETYLDATEHDENDPLLTELFDLEEMAIRWPIKSKDDALGVLAIAGISTVRGERTDGQDEVGYRRAVAWLRLNH